MNISAALILSLQVSTIAQQSPSTLTGNIEKIEHVKSAKLGNERTVIIYLPPQYKTETSRKFQILFLNDGQNTMDKATSYAGEWNVDETAESLIKAGKIQPIIIVGIYNSGMGRMDEYVPVVFKMADGTKYGGKGGAYLDFITKELRPMLSKRYRILEGAKYTGIAGSSLGGVISLEAGLRYPNIFGKLGLMSTSLWINNGEMLSRASNSGKTFPWKIWGDVGTEEGEGMVTGLTELEKVFKKLGGKPGISYKISIDQGGQHNEAAWSRRFPAMLKFLFPNVPVKSRSQ